jgi:GLPGLI family protein
MAVYESKTNTANMTSGWSGNREMTPEMKARIEERMKTMFEKTFILTFDKTTSWYSEEEKMDAVSSNQGFGRMMMSSFSSGNLFKNTKEKVFLQEREFFGKEFLIKDSLTNYKWEMSAETKQIGNYLCFKASAKKITSPTDFRSYRRTDSDKEKATQSKDSIKSKSSNLTAGWDIPKETFITAWYTMDIPISQGPENYWGLPGLILEVNDGTTTILCSKIVINPKDRKEIKQPKKGTPITQKEFEKIAQEKIEEMREMGGGMNGGGNRMRMN